MEPPFMSRDASPPLRKSKQHVTQREATEILQALPEELIHCVWAQLDIPSVLIAAEVCKSFYQFSSDNVLWYNHSRKYWNSEQEESMKCSNYASWKSYYVEKYLISRKTAAAFSSSVQPATIPSRYRHSANMVPCNDGSGHMIVMGGTGETRESTFGDLYSIEIVLGNKKRSISEKLKDMAMSYSIQCADSKVFLRVDNLKSAGQPEEYRSTRHTSCVIDNKVWFFGGSVGYPPVKNNDIHTYDVSKKRWKKVTNFKGTPPSPRSDHAAVAIGKKMYVFGGSDTNIQPQNDFFVFDTTTLTWSKPETQGEMPYPRSAHSMTVLGSKIYLFGGAQWNDGRGLWDKKSNELHVLDTETMAWSTPRLYGDVPSVSTFATVFTMGRHLFLLGGGRVNEGFVSDACFYMDTFSMEWTKIPIDSKKNDFEAKDCATAALLDDKVVIFGGYRGDPVNSMQIIDMNWFKTMKDCGYSTA